MPNTSEDMPTPEQEAEFERLSADIHILRARVARLYREWTDACVALKEVELHRHDVFMEMVAPTD